MKKLNILIIAIIVATAFIGCQNNNQNKAEESKKPQKLFITNIQNNEVYYDEQPEFEKNKVYDVELHFSNPIAKIEKKEPIALTLDGKPNTLYSLENYEIPYYHNDWYVSSKRDLFLDTVIAITYWDSTHQAEDVNRPGYMICAPKLQYFRIDWIRENAGINEMKLHIPSGTFTDIYGNKNEEINITYKKRKK